MDKFFQSFCNYLPHYKIQNNKFKKKIFYIVFSLLKFLLTGPFIIDFKKFKFFSYPQKEDYSRFLLTRGTMPDEGEIKVIKENIIDANTIFIDCGANAGFYSIPIAALNKEYKIYSFEPSAIELNLFKNNIELNNLKNIYPIEMAIGHECGTALFKENRSKARFSSGSGYIIDIELDQSNTKKVKIITIDKFIEDINIDHKKKIIIKIDLEGYDINAIFGAEKTIKKYNTLILFEFSRMVIKNKIYNIERFNNFLTNCNIKITDINYNELTINDLHSRINQLDKYHDTCGNYLLIDENDEKIKRIN